MIHFKPWFAVFLPLVGIPLLAMLTQPAPAGGVGPAEEATESQITDVSDQEFALRSRPLFNGTTLAGWEGNAYWFHTEDELLIAGRLEKPIPQNQFLCTTETFDDFDLRLDVRTRGKSPNAGVQFRSRRPRAGDNLPANEVIGYQADMGQAWGRSVWGALYDESRRRKMLAEPETPFDVAWTTPSSSHSDLDDKSTDEVSDEANEKTTALADRAVPQTAWVRMRIVCKGDEIEIFLNDIMTVRYTETEPGIARAGTIGLQIHSGPPAEAWYRNIRILAL